MSGKRRIRLIREISEISGELASLNTNPLLANQFVAFVSGRNKSRDLGGISKEFSDKVDSLTLLKQSEIASVDFENGKTQKHFEPIRSIKGGNSDYLGSLGVLLEDGTFLVGGGPPDERNGCGNLRRFANLSNVKIKKISAGKNHFLMLSEGGKVFSVLTKHAKSSGQLETGATQNHYEPVEIKGIPKIVKIRAGYDASSLVDENGDLWVFGNGWNKFPFQDAYTEPTKIASNVRNVFSGFNTSTTFIQKANGKILAGGFNGNGQCGVGFTTTNLAEWTDIKFEGKNPLEQGELKKISGSGHASFLLLADGTLFSCGGRNENGFEKSKTKFAKLWTFARRDERVLDFACGYHFSVFLTDSGRIYMAGDSNRERFREIEWRDESDREKLRTKILLGGKFKVSVWKVDNIFITEQATKEMTEKYRSALRKRLDERMRELTADFTEKLERENKEMQSKNEELAEENKRIKDTVQKQGSQINDITLDKKELAGKVKELNETIQRMSKEFADPQKNSERIAAKSAETTEIFTLLKSFDVCLAPLDTLKQIETFLHFFDFSSERTEDEIFKFYKNPKSEFESNKQRAAVEKITDILKIYKVLKESPNTKKHFEFPGAEIEFGSINRIYSDFFKCLNLSERSKRISDVFSLLDSFFRYFGVLDFDLDSLISFVSSLSDSLAKELQNLRRKLTKDLKNPPKKVLQIPTYSPTSEDAIQKYLESLDGDSTFFTKFSFLLLEVLSRFVASLSKELASKETQKLLSETIRKVSEYHWNELESRESIPNSEEDDKNEQEKLLKSLESTHGKMVGIYNEIAAAEGSEEINKYSERLVAVKYDLKTLLLALLVRRVREGELSDDRIFNKLLDVFKKLKIAKETPKKEEIVEILEEDFDFEPGELQKRLSETPKQSANSKEFSVLGFKNSEMKVKEFFYDATGDLKKEYSEIPNIEGYKGGSLEIFIEFYIEEKVVPENIQIKFVHLFSGETFGLNHPKCRNSVSLTLKELRRHNTFQITIPNLKYSGEFALVVSLLSESSRHRTFLHRKIFNIFPQEAIPEDT